MTDASAHPKVAAPWPTFADEATAVALAKHAAAAAQRHSFLAEAHVNDPVRLGLHSGLTTAYFCLAMALRELHGTSPAYADDLAERMWYAREDGATVHELLWDWLTGWGIDPDKCRPEVKPA